MSVRHLLFADNFPTGAFRLSKFAIHSCHEFEVKKVKEKERARRKEVRHNDLSHEFGISIHSIWHQRVESA